MKVAWLCPFVWKMALNGTRDVFASGMLLTYRIDSIFTYQSFIFGFWLQHIIKLKTWDASQTKANILGGSQVPIRLANINSRIDKQVKDNFLWWQFISCAHKSQKYSVGCTSLALLKGPIFRFCPVKGTISGDKILQFQTLSTLL